MAKILIDQFTLNNSIAQFHQSGFTLVGVMTGAGAGLQKLLWNVAGASQSIMAAHFPYSQESLERYLGFQKSELPKFVSKEMAYMMADVASMDCAEIYRKRKNLEKNSKEFDQIKSKCLGLAITAAVSTNRDRKGENKACIALTASNIDENYNFKYAEIIFTKGVLTREEEGEIIDLVALNVLLQHCKIPTFNIKISKSYTNEKLLPFVCKFNDNDVKSVILNTVGVFEAVYEF